MNPDGSFTQWIIAGSTAFGAGAAIYGAIAIFPRKPNISFSKPILSNGATFSCQVDGKAYDEDTYRVHFQFKNKHKNMTIRPKLEIRIPLELLTMFVVGKGSDYDKRWQYGKVDMQARESGEVVLLQEGGREPYRDIRSSIGVGERIAVDGPNNYRCLYADLPFLAPQMETKFWTRLIVPESGDTKRPIYITVSVPYFQRELAVSEKFFIGKDLETIDDLN